MVEAVVLGGALIPTRPFSLLLAILVAILASRILARRARLDGKWFSEVFEGGALVGLLGARLSFAVINPHIYQEEPWTALYLWQPGYYPWAGIFFGLSFAFYTRIAGL